ncbi:MAG: aminopeptidase P family protein [Chloroflexi bacterium]|nr:aminopeptidase P family protein [Chloroflexota bacterium]
MDTLHARMNALLERYQLDAIVASSMENVFYLTGAWIMTQKYIPDRLAMVVWPRGGEPAFIVCTIEEGLARRDSRIKNVHGYVEFQTSPIETLAEVLRGMGLEHAQIGFERKVLVASYSDELHARMPAVSWLGGDALFDELRMLKSPEEIVTLSHAAYTADGVTRDAFQMARAGRTEKEIGDWMQMELLMRGASEGVFLVLGAGDAAGLAHPSPRTRALQNGDVLRVDFGGLFGGYYADMARTMVVGTATQRQRDDYARLWQAQQETIAALKPGARASDVYRLCERRAKELGLDFSMPHIGHGIGVGLHEHPMLSPRHDTLIEENMAFMVEPSCRNADGSTFHVEDLVIVRASGPEIVSRAANWEKLPEIV